MIARLWTRWRGTRRFPCLHPGYPYNCLLQISNRVLGDPAIITKGAIDNRVPPPGDRGWKYVGQFYLPGSPTSGVAIGPNHFLTCIHCGDPKGASFVLNGTSYTPTEWHDVGPDLRLVRVSGTMPEYADLYRHDDELCQQVSMIGFGCVNGEPLVTGETLNGYYWGVKAKSWGMNVVDEVEGEGDGPLGKYHKLICYFDPIRGETAGVYAGHDSGGGTFIHDGPKWKLAGINAEVDPDGYKRSDGKNFAAGVFEPAGLYPERRQRSVSIRISKYAGAIDKLMGGK